MKKTLVLTLCGLALSGCVKSMDKQLMEENANSEHPILNTLGMYRNFENVYPYFDFGDNREYEDLTEPQIDPIKGSKVGYFNYKKYLPSEYIVDSDEDFLELFKYYRGLSNIICDGQEKDGMFLYVKKLNCTIIVDCTDLTTSECRKAKSRSAEEYLKKAETRLQWYIKYGMPEEKEKEVAERLAEEKAKEEKIKAKEEKIKAYEKCIKSANLCVDDYKVGCKDNFSDYARVISVADNGVLVQGILEKAFVYTAIKYVTDSRVLNDKYYEYVGTYDYTAIDGSRQRVYAYKETNIPVCKEP